ncbi:MAG: transcriptional regulator [Alphaproteobacteria bacterium]|nr:transcriptional regulator [Alphaproteobacteria bacterium]
MCVNPIRNEEDYLAAIYQIDSLWHAEKGTYEHNQLEVLIALIDFYEQNLSPAKFPDPIEALKFYKNQFDIDDREFNEIFGSEKETVKILNKKTPLTLSMIWKLSQVLKIPADSLIKPYDLSSNNPDLNQSVIHNNSEINNAD